MSYGDSSGNPNPFSSTPNPYQSSTPGYMPPPEQQGSPVLPQFWQLPNELQRRPVVSQTLPAQHGWPFAPQVAHEPKRHTTPESQVSPAQQVCPLAPQGNTVVGEIGAGELYRPPSD